MQLPFSPSHTLPIVLGPFWLVQSLATIGMRMDRGHSLYRWGQASPPLCPMTFGFYIDSVDSISILLNADEVVFILSSLEGL